MSISLSTLVKTSLVSTTLALATAVFPLRPAQGFELVFSDQFVTSTDQTESLGLLDYQFVQMGSTVELRLSMSNLTADQTPTGSDYYANLVGFAFDLPDILETSAYEYAYDPRESAFTSVYEQPTVSPYGEFDLGIRSGAADTGVFTEGTSSEGLVIGESAFVNLAFSRTDGTGLDASEVETWFMQDYYAANGDYGFDPIAVALFEDVGLDQSESDRVLGGYFGDAPPEDGSSSGEDGSSSGEDGSSSGEDGSSSGEDGSSSGEDGSSSGEDGSSSGEDGSSSGEDATDIPEPGMIVALGSFLFGLFSVQRKSS